MDASGKDINKGKNYIFAIAIEEYKNKSISNLNDAVSDAEYLVEIFKHKYSFEVIQDKFQQSTIVLANEDANQQNIHQCFINLITSINEADNLVVYFVGHSVEYSGVGYLLTYETETSEYNGEENAHLIDSISTELLMYYFSSIRAKDIYFIADVSWSRDVLQSQAIAKPFRETEVEFRHAIVSGVKSDIFGSEKQKISGYANFLALFLKRREADNRLEYLLKRERENFKEKNEYGNLEPVQGKLKISGKSGAELDLVTKKNWEYDIRQVDWGRVRNKMNLAELKEFNKEYPDHEEASARIDLITFWDTTTDVIKKRLNFYTPNSNESLQNKMISAGLFDDIAYEKGLNDKDLQLLGKINELIHERAEREGGVPTIQFVEVKFKDYVFKISKHLISSVQYVNFTRDKELPDEKGIENNIPVQMEIEDVKDFLGWLGEKTNTVHRLPSVEEWEIAKDKIILNEKYGEWCQKNFPTKKPFDEPTKNSRERKGKSHKLYEIIDTEKTSLQETIIKEDADGGFRVVQVIKQ